MRQFSKKTFKHFISIRSIIIFFLVSIYANSAYAQNKKEIINSLNNKVDSLAGMVTLKDSMIYQLNQSITSISNSQKVCEIKLKNNSTLIEERNKTILSLKNDSIEQFLKIKKLNENHLRKDSLINHFKSQSLVLDSLLKYGVVGRSLSSHVVTLCMEEEREAYYLKKCIWKNFMTTWLCEYNDYRGYCDNTFKLFELKGDCYVEIANSQLFNDKVNGLLSLLNVEVNKEYNLYYLDPETKDCFEGPFKPYKLSDFKLQFEEKGIVFSVDFAVPGACRAVGGSIVELSWEDLDKYLRKG